MSGTSHITKGVIRLVEKNQEVRLVHNSDFDPEITTKFGIALNQNHHMSRFKAEII